MQLTSFRSIKFMSQVAGGFLILAASCALASQTAQPDFSKYDVILTRKPFGAMPVANQPAVIPDKSKTPPAESFIKDYKMCAIRESGAGISVGIVNIKSEPVRSFFLFVGDVEEGMELLAADYDKERALLRKDGEEQWISMGPVAGGTTPGEGRGDLGNLHNLITARVQQARRVSNVPFTGWTKEVYKEKLAAGEIPPPMPARYVLRGMSDQVALTPEEREARLRSYNMDLIRSGGQAGVPLPIPLTPEEDAQLVQEGVLPPQ